MIALDLTLGAYVEMYLLSRTVSKDYANLLRARVRKFEEWCGGPMHLREMADEIVSEFLQHLLDQDTPRTTVRNYRTNLLSIWRDAYDAKLTDRWPTRVKKVSPAIGEPEAWTHEEIHQLLAAAEKMPGYVTGTRVTVASWLLSWIPAAYDSALRCSDQFALKRKKLQSDGTFSVSQRKTGYSVRCRFSARTMEAIRAMKWDGPEIWPWKVRREQFFVLQRKVVKLAGLEGTFKKLRASAGSYRELMEPGSGHKLLGHRDSAVFRRHYEDRRITQPQPLAPPPLY